jgi:hypothetical protein
VIWIAWRQQRAALLALALYALALIALMAYHRSAMLDFVAEYRMWACVDDARDLSCTKRPTSSPTWGWYDTADNVRFALLAYGGLVGAFLGALVLGAVYRWWTTALGRLLTPHEGFHAALFEAQPPAMVGYAVFGGGLGVLVGILVRRVVPALAGTLVVWLTTVYLVRRYVRPRYMTPVLVEEPYGVENAGYLADPDRWRISPGFIDLNGRFIPETNRAAQDSHQFCIGTSQGSRGDDFAACMESRGIRSIAGQVHPGDRFWVFQAIEAGLFTGVGLLCVAGAMWWLHKRFRRPPRMSDVVAAS